MIDYTKIFHTVPFSAKALKRNPDGSKTNPGFPDNWIQFQSKRNTSNTTLLGAIARQDFIGIDIDNSPLFKQALEADNDTCEYVAESDLKGGHLLYSFHEDDYKALKEISKEAKRANVDIQIDNKLIYLATEANRTKELLTEPLTQLPQTRIPQNVINLLYAHVLRYAKANPHIIQGSSTNSNENYNPDLLANSTLGYLLETDPYTEDMIGSILPNNLEERHPKEVQQGRGTAWMLSVRFKLAQDPSVSEGNFKRFMLYLNTLWEDPMSEADILNQCNHDIKNKLNNITGEVLWKYNDEWKQEGFTYSNHNKHLIEIMYDSAIPVFVEHDRITDRVNKFLTSTHATDRIMSTSKDRKKVTKDVLLKKSQPITLVNTPEKLRGKTTNEYKEVIFNEFHPSEGANILSGSLVVKDPRQPVTILKFLEHLILDSDNRLRLMQFIAHKHTTYEHSSLYFVFAGVGGAGKGVFIETILNYFSGTPRMQPVNLEKLQNNFNSWMLTTDYGIIDEAGEGNSKNQLASLVGELKRITGTSTVNATFKGKETGEAQRHYITPVLSTNMTTKLITDTSGNDRRLVFFRCPARLSKISNNDDGAFISRMISELPHFANYIKSLPTIGGNDYRDNRSWKNKDYEEYIQITISPIDKLVEAIESHNLPGVLEVLTDDLSISKHDIDSMFKTSKYREEGRLLVYNTTATLDLGMRSLFDIAAELPDLDPAEVKIRLKKLKTKISYNVDGAIYSTQVVQIPGDYKPLKGGEEIEEIKL